MQQELRGKQVSLARREKRRPREGGGEDTCPYLSQSPRKVRERWGTRRRWGVRIGSRRDDELGGATASHAGASLRWAGEDTCPYVVKIPTSRKMRERWGTRLSRRCRWLCRLLSRRAGLRRTGPWGGSWSSRYVARRAGAGARPGRGPRWRVRGGCRSCRERG